MIRTLIVDDESLARRGLKLRLAEYDDVSIVGECTNGREALASIAELSPDLVFLDIQMPGFDGFDVVRGLQGDMMPMIVFVTAFDHYAVDAFKVHAVDYLLKPVEDDRLRQALDHVREQVQQKSAIQDKERLLSVIGDITGKPPSDIHEYLMASQTPEPAYPEKIAIKDGSEITLVAMKDIDWVDAAGDYMCLHVEGKIHVMRTTMKQLEEKLDPNLFQRVHRSTLVNLQRVKKVSSHLNGEYFLILECGTRLKMSRSYKEKIQLFK